MLLQTILKKSMPEGFAKTAWLSLGFCHKTSVETNLHMLLPSPNACRESLDYPGPKQAQEAFTSIARGRTWLSPVTALSSGPRNL